MSIHQKINYLLNEIFFGLCWEKQQVSTLTISKNIFSPAFPNFSLAKSFFHLQEGVCIVTYTYSNVSCLCFVLVFKLSQNATVLISQDGFPFLADFFS